MDIYRLLTTVLLYELSTIMKAFGETGVDWLSDNGLQWPMRMTRNSIAPYARRHSFRMRTVLKVCQTVVGLLAEWSSELLLSKTLFRWGRVEDEGDQNTDCLFSSCYSSMLCQTRRWNSPVITVLEILFYISFLTCMLYKFDEIKIFKTDRLSFYLSQDDSVLPQFVSWSISLSISIKTKRSMSF